MHDIIKKALDEALTEQYYAELMGCEDTDYAFSGGFLSEMKTLIRKTDNKLIYYSKYIAAAACAVVAIGCAVLLPGLMDSRIDVVEPPETTTSAITTDVTAADTTPEVTTAEPKQTTVTADSTPSESTVTTLDTDSAEVDSADTTPPVSETTTEPLVIPPDEYDENPGMGGAAADDSEEEAEIEDDVIADENAETQTGVKDDEEAGDENPSADDTADDIASEEEAEAEADIAEDADEDTEADIDVDIEEDVEEEAEVEDDVADEDIEADVEVEDDSENPATGDVIEGDSEDDVVIEEDVEDDVEVEDDEDIEEDDAVIEDDAYIEGDDVAIEDDADDNANPETGGPSYEEMGIIPAVSMRELIENAVPGAVFDRLYLSYIDINVIDAENGGINYYRFDDNILDYEFIRQFIVSNGNLQPIYPDSYAELLIGRTMEVTLATMDDYYQPSMYDSSYRNSYDELFGGEVSEDVEEDDVEPLDEGEWICFTICENGDILVTGYDGRPAYFKADPAAATALFDIIERMNITESAATVGDIIDSAEINAANISRGTAKIRDLYDITITNVPVDSADEKKFIADFLERFRNAPVKKMSGPVNVYTCGLEIRFGLNSTSAIMKLVISSENKAFIHDGRTCYSFDITMEEIKTLITYICKCAGVADPVFYETMADYLVGKHFESLTTVYYFVNENNKNMYYHIKYDKAKLAAVYNMVLAEAANMKYSPFDSGNFTSPQLNTENWSFSVSKGGYVQIYHSYFKGPETMYNNIVAYVKANADESGCVDDEDEVEVEDDVEVEEEIDE